MNTSQEEAGEHSGIRMGGVEERDKHADGACEVADGLDRANESLCGDEIGRNHCEDGQKCCEKCQNKRTQKKIF